jgi:hypothetical protein
MREPCDKCGKKVNELWPLDGKSLCAACLPASIYPLYPGWTLAGGEEPRRKKLEKETKREP